MVTIVKRLRSLLVIFLFLLFFYNSIPSHAATFNTDFETVKVGYYENEVFEEGAAPDSVKTGYAYEYYRKLSEYTGWNYEYVYGSFGDLYDKLLAGEIDLLAGLAFREERASVIGYPQLPMGNESYNLIKHDSDTSITSNLSSVSGKKIGVLKSAIYDVLVDYLSSHSIEADVMIFDDYETLFDAFDMGDIDILAAEGDGAYGRDNAQVLCTFGTSDYYLCVSAKKPDLLEELDEAQASMAVEEANFIGNLKSRYYSSSISSTAFSAAETEWLSEHSALRVGYLNNYLPYSTTETDGSVNGIVKDLFPEMFKEMSVSGIDVTYIGYDNYVDMIEDIRTEKIDVCFPVGGGLYYSEENGIYQSTPVVSASTDLVYKGEYDEEDILTFAVNENNRMQYYYVHTNFPEANIIFYPSIDACLMAVLKGEVGSTTLNGLRATEILKNSKYKKLYLKQLSQTDDRCFGVRIGNEGLLKLLNRGLKVLGSEYSRDLAYKYSGALYSYTFLDFVRDNLWLFLFLSLLIAILIIVFVVRDLRRTRLADRMKTDFVSNMSHEIRTPITAIMGMNEMIQRESDSERILQYSANIEKAGESLLGIINDILDFSRIESGHMELSLCPYAITDLISELYIMSVVRAKEKGLGLEFDIDPSLPVMPVGDMQKLCQVITNLLTNAIKYTETGQVNFNMKLLSTDSNGFEMEVAVKDTGIGIRESEMDKLYSAFDRLDLERTRSIEGSGLGLAITKRMLALMGSDINVSSEYGKGSCFSFKIKQGISDPTPVGTIDVKTIEAGKRKPGAKTASFTAPDARILIVDDTPMNLQVIKGLLKRNEMNIETAESGSECISLIEKNTYDLVFLDHRMPNMDGVETLKKLKSLYSDKIKSTPVICLTANVLSGGREQMIKIGFTDYLTKPVNLTDMEQMLIKYLPPEKIKVVDRDGEGREENESQGQTIDEGAEIPESIRAIEALDIESGIEYCGDAEDYLDALDVFRGSADEKIRQSKELYEASDMEKMALLFHSVKSTSRAVGAGALSEHAAGCEAAARSGDTDALKNKFDVYINEYMALSDALNKCEEI